jgi:asparagine synthase (glutamine-hydrolysing)
LSEKLLLGFNRLAIVDKSSNAMQPMETAKSLMIFNGEIYNFESLRDNLNQYNLNFKSYSDAEVLQQYIDHKGLDALNDLNGMFAIAYFNKESETLHLIRDRFGVKPLYYHVGKDKVFFASEVKALLPIIDNLEINSIKRICVWNHHNLNNVTIVDSIKGRYLHLLDADKLSNILYIYI